MNTNTITINNIESGDEGLYTCKYESPDDNGSGEGSMGEGLAGCILIYCELQTVCRHAHVHVILTRGYMYNACMFALVLQL